jgi:hypothetical protein
MKKGVRALLTWEGLRVQPLPGNAWDVIKDILFPPFLKYI